MYYTMQTTENGCGNAVIKTMLANAFHDHRYLNLELKEEHDSFTSIIKECERNGLILIGKKSEEYKDFNKKKGLMIAHFNVEGSLHFVVVKSKGGKYLVCDPGRGQYYLSNKEFNSYFSGYFMEIDKKAKKNIINQQKTMIKTTNFIPYYVLQLISIGLFIAGLITLNKENLIYLTITFLAMAMLMSVFSKYIILNVFSIYEKNTNHLLIKSSEKKFRLIFDTLSLNKNNIIEGPVLIFSAITVSSIVIGLILINDWFLFIGLLVVTIGMTMSKYMRTMLNASHIRVDRLLKIAEKDEKKRPNSLNEIEKVVNAHSRSLVLIDSFKSFLIIFVLLLIMALNKITSLNYLIFYFFIFITFTTNIEKIFNYDQQIALKTQAITKINEI